MHDLKQPFLAAKLAEFSEQRVCACVRVGFCFPPAEPILLRGLNHAVAEPLGLVACHH